MAMRRLTPEEFAAELEGRGCHRVKSGPAGYTYWETDFGEPFSVPPPEETASGGLRYPDWMLDDLIREVGLPPTRRTAH